MKESILKHLLLFRPNQTVKKTMFETPRMSPIDF